MGVVYHSNYLLYFEMGRTELMRAAGLPYSELEQRGFFLAVTRAHLNYRASARYDVEIAIRTRVTEVGKASVRFDYEVRGPGDEVLCDGYTELACVDRAQKVMRLPTDVVERLVRG